jgi:hypothetical protein
MAVAVNPTSAATLCNSVNELCTTVTVCQPNTSTCQTVTDVLVDTGSYGLRLFASVLTVSLTPVTSGGALVGECAFFGSHTTTWGPVRIADVGLGGEPTVKAPVQVIDPTFAGQYTANGSPARGGNRCSVGVVESSPSDSGFNGLLGIGLFTNDAQAYYACTGASCPPLPLPPSQQVQNPVALLPVDNNGIVVMLPPVGSSGAFFLNGSVLLGIGTQSNNQPSGVTVHPANSCGRFITTYKGTTFQSSPSCSGGAFLDTGSNGLFFPDASIQTCAFGLSGFYCPPVPQNLTATTTGAFGAPSTLVNFQVANAGTLLATGNAVFNNLGGPVSGFFDWGLPFFLGRTVYVGIEGRSSVLGAGPFWAY